MLATILPHKDSLFLNIEISALLHLNFSQQMQSEGHRERLIFKRDAVPHPHKYLASHVYEEDAPLVGSLHNAPHF